MVHNHPSGDVGVSVTDKDITDRLIQVGQILDIKVFDHVIISLNSFFSFNDIGLMSELEKSTKWMPTEEQLNRIKKEYKEMLIAEKEEAYIISFAL